MTDPTADPADTPDRADQNSVIPAPPTKPRSRKRPCGKQNPSREARKSGARPAGQAGTRRSRKLNTYALDIYTGMIHSIRDLSQITKGMRVIEQPPGHSRPSINAFFDASLLPEGSTITPRWGHNAAELDTDLVSRLGRLSRLAGYGEQARKTMFDQIACSADPAAAMIFLIGQLGGPDALEAAPGDLTTDTDRAGLAALIPQSLNAANATPVDFADPLPPRLDPSARLSEHLKDLPGAIGELEADGNGTRILVRGHRFEDKSEICNRLRAAGARGIEVKNTIGERDGRKVRGFAVSAHLNAAPVDVAAARTGKAAECVYTLDDDGQVQASYRVDLYGQSVATPMLPCEPSILTVRTLVEHAARTSPTIAALVDGIAVGFEDPQAALASHLGPVRTISELEQRAAGVSVDEVLGQEFVERLADAPSNVITPSGRRVPVSFKGGFAVLDEVSLHPSDLTAALLPETIDAVEDGMPTMVTQIRFETKGPSSRPRVVAQEVPVTELIQRREKLLERKGPRESVLAECRENFLADATRAMAAALNTPPTKPEEVRNPEAVAKRRTLNNHIDPYLANGGALVQLVSVLATGQGEEAWVTWCRSGVKEFSRAAARQRREGGEGTTDFFAAINAGPEARNLLEQTAAALLSARFERPVEVAEVAELTGALAAGLQESRFTAIDRGRALAAFLKPRRQR